jgi:hypothetical protein
MTPTHGSPRTELTAERAFRCGGLEDNDLAGMKGTGAVQSDAGFMRIGHLSRHGLLPGLAAQGHQQPRCFRKPPVAPFFFRDGIRHKSDCAANRPPERIP